MEYPVEIVEELKKAEEIENIYDIQEEIGDYTEITNMTKKYTEETKKLVKDRKVPKKDIIKDISNTDIVVDLALSSVAKQTALKLLKLEEFLSKIEDRLYSENTIKDMPIGDLANLYNNTRLMRAEAFRMLKEIRKEVDFSSLEASLLSLHSKIEMDSEDPETVKSVIEEIIMDDAFLEIVRKND